jgi:ubiquinol-cytochrome c reductase cytochrome b subunit
MSVGEWLDERLGHRALLQRLMDHEIPGGARWAYVFGSAITFALAIQIVTGLALMTAYSPGTATAWASVHFITHNLPAGWVLRGMHHWGSQAMIVLLGAHLLQTGLFGAYRRPRELNWYFGLALLGLTFALSQTGTLLPADQKGYWATRVDTNIAGTSPVIGGVLQRLILGGADYGSLTLTRFYALHVALLPLAMIALTVLHVAVFRKHGVTPPHGVRAPTQAFFPRQAALDLAGGMVVLAAVLALTLRAHGAPLDAPADPTSDYPARPEWYFMSLFELRKLVHGPLETPVILATPAVVGGYLALLPVIDRSGTNALRGRLAALSPLLVGFAGMLAMLALALAQDGKDAKYQAARAEADASARTASVIAMGGVPVEGPLYMLAHDPELRGRALFKKSCAPCHVLGDLGDAKKATGPALDGWGTEAWVASMMDDPDAPDRFGHTPFKTMMPSMLRPAPDRKPEDGPFKPMPETDIKAVAVFLASRSDGLESTKPPVRDAHDLEAGEKIVSVRCTTCHLWKGDGDDASQGYAPELSAWGTAAWVSAQIANPATKATYRESALDPKMKHHMPRFDGDLPAADIELLARWTTAHSHGRKLPRP